MRAPGGSGGGRSGGAPLRPLALLLLSGALAAGSAPSARAAGGQARVERFDLPRCVRMALDQAPEIDVARSEVVVRRAKLREAEAARILPEAEASEFVGPARRARGNVIYSPDSVTTRALGPFTRVEVSLVQPLFTWGKITAGIEAATHAVEAQVAASQGVASDVIQQTKALYYNALLARSVEGIVEEVNDAFSSALETAERRRDQGDPDVTELGVLYLRVGQAQSAKELPLIRRGSENALAALRRMIGLPPGTPLELGDRRLRAEPATLAPLADYRDRLFRNNPAWRQIDAGIAAKAQEVRTVEADFFPMFFLAGSFNYSYAPRRDRQTNPFAYDPFNALNGPGGVLGIRWPLNFHVTAARVDTARAELGHLEARKRQASTGLPLELEIAYNKVVDTREAVDKADGARKAARAILTFTVTNFDIGIGEPREIIEGLATYSRVSTDYYETTRDYDLALAALSRVLGEEVSDLDIPSVSAPGGAPLAVPAPAGRDPRDAVVPPGGRGEAAALDSLSRGLRAATDAATGAGRAGEEHRLPAGASPFADPATLVPAGGAPHDVGAGDLAP